MQQRPGGRFATRSVGARLPVKLTDDSVFRTPCGISACWSGFLSPRRTEAGFGRWRMSSFTQTLNSLGGTAGSTLKPAAPGGIRIDNPASYGDPLKEAL